MIELTKLNKKPFYLNCDLIESIETTPDTVITLRNGKLLIVSESPQQIAELVLAFKRSQYSELLRGVLGSMRENNGPARQAANGSGEGK